MYIYIYIYNAAFKDSTCVQTKEKEESTSVKTMEKYKTTKLFHHETTNTTFSIGDDSKHIVDDRKEPLRYFTHKHIKFTINKQFLCKIVCFFAFYYTFVLILFAARKYL